VFTYSARESAILVEIRSIAFALRLEIRLATGVQEVLIAGAVTIIATIARRRSTL